jgi:hypothetical protein
MYVKKADVEKRETGNHLIEEFLVPENDGFYFECLREISNHASSDAASSRNA